MLTDKRLLEVASDIYESAINPSPSSWRASLTSISDIFSSDMAAVVTQENASGFCTWSQAAGIDRNDQIRYTTYYGTISPNFQHLQTTGTEDIITDEMHVNRRVYTGSEIYNDYFKPLKIERNVTIIMERTAQDQTYLCLRRPERKRYSDTEIQSIRRFVPHLYRAIKIERRIRFEGQLKNELSTTLDHLKYGVILVSASGEIINFNLEAERIIANHDGISVRKNQLYINENGSFINVINFYQRGELPEFNNLNSMTKRVLIKRPQKRPYILSCHSLTQMNTIELGQSGMAIFITDTERKLDLDIQGIREFFGLTRAEARLSLALVEGKSLTSYASEANIAISTVRSTLKSVFRKTQTCRQAELVQLFLLYKPIS